MFQGPSLDEVRVANPMSRRPYLERINVAYSYASAELLDLIVNKVIYCSEPVGTTSLTTYLSKVREFNELYDCIYFINSLPLAICEAEKYPGPFVIQKLTAT